MQRNRIVWPLYRKKAGNRDHLWGGAHHILSRQAQTLQNSYYKYFQRTEITSLKNDEGKI